MEEHEKHNQKGYKYRSLASTKNRVEKRNSAKRCWRVQSSKWDRSIPGTTLQATEGVFGKINLDQQKKTKDFRSNNRNQTTTFKSPRVHLLASALFVFTFFSCEPNDMRYLRTWTAISTSDSYSHTNSRSGVCTPEAGWYVSPKELHRL